MNKKKIISGILKGSFRYPFYKSKYCIKRGYFHRKKYTYYDNTPLADEWQNEVYEIALNYFNKLNLNSIIDFGCGSAFKLMKFFPNAQTIGIDVKETVEYLKNKYPDKNWIDVNELDNKNINCDMVICSDVIEHVLDPDDFIDQIKKLGNFKYLFISTPERNIINGFYDFGPPKNRHHIREWTGWEFRNYISKKFDIKSHMITNFTQGTQLIIATKKKA